MHYFHQGATNRGTSSKVPCSNMLIRQNWEDLFLKVMKITCSVRQDLNLWSKSIKLDLSKAVSMSFSNKLTLKDWTYRTLIMDILNLEENNLAHKKNYPSRKRFSEMLKIRNFRELGEMKRAQELRVDEFSVQTSREVMKQYRDSLRNCSLCKNKWINSVNDSGEFQEVESNHSGRLSHVPSQPEVIPSASSMLSRDKRLPFDTWNALGLQENVFGNQFSTFGLPRNPSQGIHYGVAHEARRETESVPRATGTGTSCKRWRAK